MDEKNKYVDLPFIPLIGQTFFPGTTVSFDIGREKSLNAINQAANGDKLFVVATQIDDKINNPDVDDCYKVGVLIRSKQIIKKSSEYVRVLATCEKRVDLENIRIENDIFICDCNVRPDLLADDEIETKALARIAKKSFSKHIDLVGNSDNSIKEMINKIDDITLLCNTMAGEIKVSYEAKQELLEQDLVYKRLEKVIQFLNDENQILMLEKRISAKVMGNLNQSQREYFLKEQIKVIKDELGETEDVDDEANEWLATMEGLNLPEKIKEKIEKEITKFTRMHQSSPESTVTRTYIETILSLPWNTASKINVNIKKADKILNEDHYGLEQVKERILEYLAVVHLSKNIKGPIICLVGPPGVGKTSIAKSIARATNREFARMSLGGVRDEAEIRGHRRTYIGSIPGRVINNIKEVGTNNPLFLFDEVDKIGSEFKGDPASALLEVLDPEQNKTFVDNYLEVPFDLSKVMFITTANTTETIPSPLLDRMEVIEISGYIEDEKLKIAENYLIPKKIAEHGIKKNRLTFSESAVRDIINDYTRESGVRNLEREIANICRKVAKQIVMDGKKTQHITARSLDGYLGKKKFRSDIVGDDNKVGVTTGMAWTRVGGTILFIEALKVAGSGKVVLTGQMGDVMKESAQAGISYLRSIADEYGIKAEVFQECDIHIHIPEGATPKDGPSAGVTMCTALLSAITGKEVINGIAMTGEITIRGKVLPVGGIKEKVLAAHRAGITKILIPRENEADLEEIPKTVRKQIKFVLIDEAKDVFEEALVK
ncbi:MAG: endopeptidase La [Peptostreptococcaceae bacterium]|nr:endopeptidase La [Peptostreptococcaceae bacterium]